MGRGGGLTRTPVPRALALGSLLVAMAGSGSLGAGGPASGTERWQGREIAYDLAGPSDSDIQFSRSPRECHVTSTVDGVTRVITLRDEDILVASERLDTGHYDDVSLTVARDFLILGLVTTRSWSDSASGSARTEASAGSSHTTATRASESRSSGQSTHHHAFGFTELKGAKIRVRLEGGRSADCSITTGPDQRVIRFDVDEGENQGSLVIKDGLLSLDGVQRNVGHVAEILVTATKRSLRITADETEIWVRG